MILVYNWPIGVMVSVFASGIVRFGLLFDGISTFLGYLMQKPSF